MIDKNSIGKRIAALRKKLNYSQAEFAEKMNVSAQAVSKWETGIALPDIEILLNISWISNTPLNNILEGDNFSENTSGVERSFLTMNKLLMCPQCKSDLKLNLYKGMQKLCYECGQGHKYDVIDGVVYFNTQEMQGEQWSLFFNYDYYLKEHKYPVNLNYSRSEINHKEVMWQEIEKLRPRVILDMACGTGQGIKHIIKKANFPVTIIMADLSHRVLKWNRQFYSTEWKNPYVDIVYLACDCINLPIFHNKIDMVFSNFGFESMRNPMKGFKEAYRVLKPSANAVYTLSAVDNHKSENTKKWLQLYMNLPESYHPENTKITDITQWIEKCEQIGFKENKYTKVYGELTAPEDNIFPFDQEVLQWMGLYAMRSKKHCNL